MPETTEESPLFENRKAVKDKWIRLCNPVFERLKYTANKRSAVDFEVSKPIGRKQSFIMSLPAAEESKRNATPQPPKRQISPFGASPDFSPLIIT